jgi:hypothetical protein
VGRRNHRGQEIADAGHKPEQTYVEDGHDDGDIEQRSQRVDTRDALAPRQ